MNSGVDELDARIISVFTERPSIGVLGASRALGVARGTVQARLERLQERGVIRSMAPTISPAALGFPVTAFCSLQIRQTPGQSPVGDHLARIPEVIEAYTITGTFDLFVIAVARSNEDLQRVIDAILDHDDIQRASTQIALATHLERRTLPLVRAASAAASRADAAASRAERSAPAAHPRTA